MGRKLLTLFMLLIVFSSGVLCQTEQLVINLSQTSFPGLLTFENPKGSIRVTGYDGNTLLVNGTRRFNGQEKPPVSGLRRLDGNDIDISAEVNAKNVTLFCRATGKTVDFDIKVPRNFSVRLKSLDNGNIEIVNLNGEIEVENNNGDISLENIAGSAVLSTVYGKITAVFREVTPNSPMMFSSFEGDITITFPQSINALLKMKSEKGELLSDFDIKPAKRQAVIKNVDNSQIYSLEDWVVGSVNSGGPEYVIRSYDGNVCIRKK